MDLWNNRNLSPPPITSCKCSLKEIDVRLLDITLRKAIDFFKNQQHLCAEAALLSRAIYRFKMKFRSSKEFKALEKLSRVLRTYLQINVTKLFENLLNSLPQTLKSNSFIFTKNMLDYVLVRLQGLGKVLCRALETCKIITTLLHQRLKIGHFWRITLIMYAATSRIFVIVKSILKYVCEVYSNLLPFSSTLNNSAVKWLPDDYNLPNRLDDWLDIDWIELDNNVIEIEDETPLSFFNLIDSDDEDVEFCDEYILVKDESFVEDSEEVEVVEDIEVDLTNDQSEIDIGEVININDSENKKSKKRKRRFKNINEIKKKRKKKNKKKLCNL